MAARGIRRPHHGVSKMRVLSLEELELVAGRSTTNDPGYNVPGYYPGGDPVVSQAADPGAGGAGDAGSGSSGGGAGGGLGSDPGDPGWRAHTRPWRRRRTLPQNRPRKRPPSSPRRSRWVAGACPMKSPLQWRSSPPMRVLTSRVLILPSTGAWRRPDPDAVPWLASRGASRGTMLTPSQRRPPCTTDPHVPS